MSYQSLETFAIELEDEYLEDEGAEMWDNSAFSWIRDNKSATIGAIGRRLARNVFQSAGVNATFAQRILRIGDVKVVVKFSMEWTGGGFVFEQLKDTNYNFVFCLGIRPDSAFGWLIPKEELIVDGIWQTRDGLRPQHTGATGQETAWLDVNPDSIYPWLQPFGGNINAVEAEISSQLG